MTPHTMSSSNFVDLGEAELPWGEEIWQAEGSWFTLAQLLWVKLYGSSMSYGQLHYVVSAPLMPGLSRGGRSRRWGQGLADDGRSRVYEMELIMDPLRGILLIGEVYGKPGDRVWQPDRIYRGMLELGVVLTEFFQRELHGEQEAVFCPEMVLVLRDVERDALSGDSALEELNTITRDELSTIRQKLDKMMDIHANHQAISFSTYGHLLISALRNISENSRGELGGFRTADEIYQIPSLPAWLR